MPQSNRKQAWLIPSAEALPNPVGTAPGWFVRVRAEPGAAAGKVIVALPGPPREMHRMWREQVLPRLPQPTRALRHTTLHTQGIGESHIADLLGTLTAQANPSVATYARKTGVDVRVAASADSPQEALALLQPVLEDVSGRLERWVWGTDTDTLAGVVSAALAGRTLGVIEAGSAGALCTLLADEPGFLDAAVTSDHRRLITLGLTPVTLKGPGLVSEQAARELAQGAREHLGADLGLSVVLEPRGEQAGQAYAALSGPGLSETAAVNWPGDPAQLRERAAVMALALAYRALARAQGQPETPGGTP